MSDINFGLLPGDNGDGTYNGADTSTPLNQQGAVAGDGWLRTVGGLLNKVSGFKPPTVNTNVAIDSKTKQYLLMLAAGIAAIFFISKKR